MLSKQIYSAVTVRNLTVIVGFIAADIGILVSS